MLTRLLVFLTSVSPGLRRALWKWWYNKLARQIENERWTFMNYGFQPGGGEAVLELKKEDEADRYCIQLYERVTRGIDLAGKEVMEVGSGRGGGASYLARYRGPKLVLGIDYSRDASLFCDWRHAEVANVDFEMGDAENLAQANSSFDAVVNVESSHCYGNIRKFFDEVARTLRPGGHFLFADLRGVVEMDELKRTLRETKGLEIVAEEDISSGVVAAMEADEARKREMIGKLVPPAIRPLFEEFAGMRGGQVFEGLKNGKLIYARFVARRI